jgi:hypothetical protein
MRNKTLLAALVVLLSLFVVGTVVAQGTTNTKAPGTWSSSINIQNTGPSAANIVLSFYDTAGTRALDYTVAPPIAAGGSRSLYVPTQIPGLASGQFSVVASSDQPLQVVVNSSSSSPSAGAYAGVQGSSVGKSLNFPGLYKSYYGYWSEIVLQNTEASAASATFVFYDQSTGAVAATVGPVTIPATSSRVFALQDLSSVPSGNVNGLLSASVTSDKNLAGIANIWTVDGKMFSDYEAFMTGSTLAYAPALYKNYYNFVSALTVQNLHATDSADIKVTYSNGITVTKTLLPHQSIEYYQPNNTGLPSGNTNGVFSAKIESTNGKPIVSLVTVRDTMKGSLCSYDGPTQATTSVNLPVVLKSFYNFFSAQTVQNVGTGPTNITINYASGQTRTFNNVPANGTVNIVELESAGSVLPNVSSVSAVVTSSSQPIVAVVQENDTGPQYIAKPGDYLFAYSGVPQ